ncbi:lipopolysaccharide assembly protein LapA domain-containing protein [Streptomyces sp. NPDC127098]|uniref:lipopolysaccharide assembly protein LapA domain-containing protein n=1 Tax=Streptomyces sp. NPDC127098 TaxID=3347137 RepID=UPI003665D94A
MRPDTSDEGPYEPPRGGPAGGPAGGGRPVGGPTHVSVSQTEVQPGFWNTSRVIAALISALVLVFIFQNTRTIKVHLLIPEVRLPLWVVLLGTAFLGMLAGMFWAHRRRVRRARR